MRRKRTEQEMALVRDAAERERAVQEAIYPDQEVRLSVNGWVGNDKPDWIISRSPKSD